METQHTPAAGPAPDYLTEREAAAILRLSPRTLQRHRQKNTGPTFLKMGPRKVCYTRPDLDAWAKQGRPS
ncbi:helix-turn-helix transcriptional regulator [Azospirillum sp.]|uniref:helix-turn-helix transcriptional regulator n=1 Tax=Azospirillum sp. TaxID=34012 RepID=UPI003D743F34